MIRKLTSVLLMMALIICTLTFAVAADIGANSQTGKLLARQQPGLVPWSGASAWATAELEKADGYGLIPEILQGADMTKSITREEFAALAVKLYEKAAGTAATPASPNPFTDTDNPEILKAFKLGVTTGSSATTFAPQVLINREQCAAMLFRTLKAIAPAGDFSIEGVEDFPDQKHIESYAVEAVKYMSRTGIIGGDLQGNFMPKATTTAQQASGYGMATREQAIVMSVRSFEKMDTIKATSGNDMPAGTSAALSSPVAGTWTLGNISGGQYDAVSGRYQGGASGLGQIYTFKEDGTYTALVIWSNAIYLAGKYSVKEDVLTLTDRTAEESNDGGKTWGAKETLPDASAYFTAGTDDTGKYLVMGQEGATPPLNPPANALKYKFRE